MPVDFLVSGSTLAARSLRARFPSLRAELDHCYRGKGAGTRPLNPI